MEKVKLGPKTLLYPMPAVLAGAVVDGKPNFMTVAWCGMDIRDLGLSSWSLPNNFQYVFKTLLKIHTCFKLSFET